MSTLAIAFVLVSNSLDLPPNLLSAVCYVESKHVVSAIHVNDGGSDSLGLCQIKLNTARQFGFKGTAKQLQGDYKINMVYAGKYLRYQIKRYNGDTIKAVAAYNAGSYKPHKTNKYVNKVLLAWSNTHGEN